MWIYFAIFLAAVFFSLYKYSTRKFDHWKKRNVFYMKPIPFFGNILDILTTKHPLGINLLKLCDKAGDRDFFGLFVFDRPVLMVKSPKIMKAILQKDAYNFIDRSSANTPKHPILSNALFVQKSPVWKEHRTKLSPIFTSGKLKVMFLLMVKEAEKMVDYISKLANIPDVETKEICAKYSTNVISRTAFAVDAKSYEDENAIFRQLGRKMFDFRISTALRQMASFFAPDLCNRFTIPFFDISIIDSLEKIFYDVLHTRMASKNLQGNDFVDILLEAQKKSDSEIFSENALLGQAIQFFGAGFETVAATLSFTLYELCVHTDVQERLRDEINETLKKNNGIMTYEALHEMKYLDMCVSETLRKYPPLGILDRVCKDDYRIEGTDFIIEKGTVIYMTPYAGHYDPKYFPNPEEYDPERFADKSSLNQDGLMYIPFGDGPRICIGQRFGLMETKTALIGLLSKYKLEKSPKTPIPLVYSKRSLILQSVVGIPLKFVPI